MIQHPELDGPFSVATAWTTQVTDGASQQVPTAWADNRWNATQRFFNANSAALTPYRVAPGALSRVWAGDDPANPQWTVALAFPDSTTATTVLTACGAVP